MSLPTLTGIGRLTADPELRFSGSGVAVCSMQLAFNSRKKDPATQEWVDGDVLFLKATAFRDVAEHIAESLTKGSEVIVTGRVKTEQWESREGDKRSAPALLIDSIGPSLRYATAKVSKAQRSGSGEQTGSDPWATEQPTKQQATYDDEPPF